MSSEKMTSYERRAICALSTIMGLRMIGLFMVLPLFTLYASHLQRATPTLIGVSVGIYGLFQALLQIPFGSLSDHFGRKPIILVGLLLFALGSLIAANAHDIYFMILGRALQGAGAVGSTILAMMADVTREECRTKSMAIAGIAIGFSFSIAMIIGPLLSNWMSVNSLFFLAMLFALIAIIILYTLTPTPKILRWHRDTEPELKAFIKLLLSPELAKLNIGILILHALFTASFVVIPISVYRFNGLSEHHQWTLYLPAFFVALIVSLFFIGIAERTRKLKPFFLSGIVMLALSEFFLWLSPTHFISSAISLCLFFSGFSLLEAFLPSLISRTAPAARKGSALGIYSCAQFLGIFIGGVLGGWLYGKFGLSSVYLFCLVLAFFWFMLAYRMQPPRYLVSQMLHLTPRQQKNWESIMANLQIIPGIVEVSFVAEEGLAYLKMEHAAAKHPDFIHLKEQLQSE